MNKHMEYQEFIKMLCQKVNEAAKNWDGAQAEFQPDVKEDGKTMELLVIKLRENSTRGSHVISIQTASLYKAFTNGRIELEQVLDLVEGWFSRAEEVEAISPMDEIEDYEKIRDCLIIRPLNYTRNKEKLENEVYVLVGDIALTLYVHFGFIRDTYISSAIGSSYLDLWHKEKEEVLKNAMINTSRLFPPVLLKDLEALPLMDIEVSKEDFMRDYMALLTNKHGCNGAVSIFLPGVAKRFGEVFNSDLYIAFLSNDSAVIHEAGKVQPDEIRKTISSVNEVSQDKDHFLSDKVFVYRRDTDRIEIVEENDI